MREKAERNEVLFRAVLAGMNFKEVGKFFAIRPSYARVVFRRGPLWRRSGGFFGRWRWKRERPARLKLF